MFNLIMRWFEDYGGSSSISLGRVFEYTEPHLAEQFREHNRPNLAALTRLPCLFMNEGIGQEICRVGSITRTRIANGEIHFDYVLDEAVPPLRNELIFEHRQRLDMPEAFEFSRNHWAIKDINLYRFLFQNVRPGRQRPTVFRLPEHEAISDDLVSVMMPFDAGFNDVHESIRAAAAANDMRCQRADDIWEHPEVIQDVVSLIDRSKVVICDCTNRNPNVFYEAGIAHTLGREVILITQSEHDIPFDLRHLRYIRYLNNAEGRAALTQALAARIGQIVAA